MPVFSQSFKKLTYRLIIAGIFILVSFQFGNWLYFFRFNKPNSIPINVKNLATAFENAKKNGIRLVVDDKSIVLNGKEIADLTEPYIRDYNGQTDIRFSDGKLRDYLETLAPHLDKSAVDAKFQFNDNRAEIFTPSMAGRKLNIEKTEMTIQKGIASGATEINIEFDAVEPLITLEKINSLGITRVIATGESNFAGSSPSRILNIKIASAKYNGLILKPNKEFSFNTVLGPVDEKGGYAAEKVIKNHSLVYEYGGGICQVSTTLFRAAVLAGLPILERKPHAFPVQYYNPQGFDATIYPGITDLRFKNDTGGYILLQTKISGTKLSFEIYGAKPNRTVELVGPVQYDQKSDGSMKAYFVRKIIATDGSVSEKRFDSIYRSPLLYPLGKNPLE